MYISGVKSVCLILESMERAYKLIVFYSIWQMAH